MKRIIFAHLLNDYSGSPLVLSTVIRQCLKAGMEVEVVTSKEGEGFLSDIEGVCYHYIDYRFHESKPKRTLALLRSQAAMFGTVLRRANQGSIVYVNTLLPFGAALAGKLLGKKVVYHLHETKVNPPFLKAFLKKTAAICASEAVYVSNFLIETEPLKGVPSRVVRNCLATGFADRAAGYLAANPTKSGPFTVLMLCSLKAYKGVNEYLELAKQLPELNFVLVLSTSFDDINRYFNGMELPDNFVVFPAQKDVHLFYQQAHLVMNLSHPVQCVETFGMTLLEAMSYGLPVIAPPVGGPAELVQDGFNGYQIDQRNHSQLAQKLREMCQLAGDYQLLSANARTYAKRFSERQFAGELVRVVA